MGIWVPKPCCCPPANFRPFCLGCQPRSCQRRCRHLEICQRLRLITASETQEERDPEIKQGCSEASSVRLCEGSGGAGTEGEAAGCPEEVAFAWLMLDGWRELGLLGVVGGFRLRCQEGMFSVPGNTVSALSRILYSGTATSRSGSWACQGHRKDVLPGPEALPGLPE